MVLANKLGGASFATLLLLILWASWKNLWTWSRDVDKVTARYEELLTKERDEKEWWRTIAMRATGIAEMQGSVASALATKKSSD